MEDDFASSYDLTHSTDDYGVAGGARDEHENGSRSGCRSLYAEYAARSGVVSAGKEVAMEASNRWRTILLHHTT
jgi:hypothetical protein